MLEHVDFLFNLKELKMKDGHFQLPVNQKEQDLHEAQITLEKHLKNLETLSLSGTNTRYQIQFFVNIFNRLSSLHIDLSEDRGCMKDYNDLIEKLGSVKSANLKHLRLDIEYGLEKQPHLTEVL